MQTLYKSATSYFHTPINTTNHVFSGFTDVTAGSSSNKMKYGKSLETPLKSPRSFP